MNYIVEESKVIYKSKNGSDTKEFDVLDFIASLCSHIPNMGEQMVRYNGYYSNVRRGRRKKESITESDFVIEDNGYTKSANKSWSRLIRKYMKLIP